MRIAILPGSFDPITMGHLDVLQRALHIFDKIIIAVGEHPDKKYLFSVEERMTLIQQSLGNLENVTIEHFTGLLTDFAKQKNAVALIRGLRAVSDFDYEFQTALMNQKLASDIESVFIMTRGMYIYLSSSLVKEVAQLHGNLDGMVSEPVKVALETKFA